MNLNQQKEEFSRAWVRAVAAVSGFVVSQPSVDDDSVDIQFAAGAPGPFVRRPRLEAQLKCTAAERRAHEGIQFDLPIKNYDDLRLENLIVPRILVVVCVPDSLDDWLSPSQDEMLLRYCGYWLSLRGIAEVPNSTTRSVVLPRTQVFDAASLTAIMERIEAGGVP